MSTSEESFHSGDLLKIKSQIKNTEVYAIWLVLFEEKNLTKGY
jgi:hypothetical protein